MTQTHSYSVWFNKLYTLLPWIPVVGLLMLCSAMPYRWSAYHRVASYIFVVGYIVWFVAYHQWKEVRWTHSKWLYVIMIALFVMFPLRQLFDPTPPTAYYYRYIGMHDWFLYTGIIGILGFPDKLRLRYVAYVLLLTSVVMLGQCAYLYWGTTEYAEYGATLERFNQLRMHHISSHMIMNLYINIALVLGFCALRERSRWWQHTLIIIAMALGWLLILLSLGRAGLVTSLLVLSVGIIYLMACKYAYWAIVPAVICTLTAFGIMVYQPRLSVDKVTSDPRTDIWDYSVRLAQERPVCGYGLSTLSEVYVERAYEDSVMYNGFIKRTILYQKEFRAMGKTFETHHPHNAFITYWLAIGVIGVILLLALFVVGASLPVGNNRIFLWLFLLAVFIQCLTEPIGAHLTPHMIASILFIWEKCCDHRAVLADNS